MKMTESALLAELGDALECGPDEIPTRVTMRDSHSFSSIFGFQFLLSFFFGVFFLSFVFDFH
jgi:hypothetical protein